MVSVVSFLKRFPDDDACWRHLEHLRWPNGPVCLQCGHTGPTSKCGREHYHRCKACGYRFTVAFGTPLEGTHLPMRTCFTAMYLMVVASKGLSSVALGRHLGIGQKTAWFLGHRIRAMMEDKSGLLNGIVEADETYVGGQRKQGQKSQRDKNDDQPKGRGGSRKPMVVAAAERGGKVRAKRAGTHSGKTIATFLLDNVCLQDPRSWGTRRRTARFPHGFALQTPQPHHQQLRACRLQGQTRGHPRQVRHRGDRNQPGLYLSRMHLVRLCRPRQPQISIRIPLSALRTSGARRRSRGKSHCQETFSWIGLWLRVTRANPWRASQEVR